MKAHTERLALVQGWDDTKLTLRLWLSRPAMVLRPWTAGSEDPAMKPATQARAWSASTSELRNSTKP